MRPKILSLGTCSGYPGAGSWADLDETLSKTQILVIWDLTSLTILVPCLALTKTPKTFPSLCEAVNDAKSEMVDFGNHCHGKK